MGGGDKSLGQYNVVATVSETLLYSFAVPGTIDCSTAEATYPTLGARVRRTIDIIPFASSCVDGAGTLLSESNVTASELETLHCPL